jgi:hypothetical protein
MSAITTTNVALVARLLNDIAPDIIKKLVQDHQTASIVRRYGSVKKSLTFLVRRKNKRILRGFKADGNAKGDEYSYDEVTLEVGKFMAILDLTATDEKVEAFGAHLKASGTITDSLTDDVFLTQLFQYILSESQEDMGDEMEDADWQAIRVTTGVNAAADADMIHKFDGYRRLAATLAATGKGTVVNTAGLKPVRKVEAVYRGFDKQIKRRGGVIFCTYNFFDLYKLDWQDMNQGRELGTERLEGTNYEGIAIYLGGKKTMLVPVSGMGDDDALIGTLPQYMAMGYDLLGEIDVQKVKFTMTGYMAMKYGVMYLQQLPGYIVVSDDLIQVEITAPRINA